MSTSPSFASALFDTLVTYIQQKYTEEQIETYLTTNYSVPACIASIVAISQFQIPPLETQISSPFQDAIDLGQAGALIGALLDLDASASQSRAMQNLAYVNNPPQSSSSSGSSSSGDSGGNPTVIDVQAELVSTGRTLRHSWVPAPSTDTRWTLPSPSPRRSTLPLPAPSPSTIFRT